MVAYLEGSKGIEAPSLMFGICRSLELFLYARGVSWIMTKMNLGSAYVSEPLQGL